MDSNETQQRSKRRTNISESLKKHRIEREGPGGVREANWGKVSEKLSSDLIEALVDRQWPIVIHGPVGTGKSCAMSCIFQRWPSYSIWKKSSELLSSVVRCRTSKTGSITVTTPTGQSYEQYEGNIYKKIRDVHLLCLDDVGVKRPTEVQRDIFNELIDLRLDKPTIMTTNLDQKTFGETFDNRILSRTSAGVWLYVEGKDRRIYGG